MDLLRRAVGDRKLTYAGYSYGSYLGATYANLFPGKVRALVVDGVLDPVAWSTGRGDQARTLPFSTRVGSAKGAYQTLQEFLRLCDAGGPSCAFSDGDPKRRFDRLARRLLREPVEFTCSPRGCRPGARSAGRRGPVRRAGRARPGAPGERGQQGRPDPTDAAEDAGQLSERATLSFAGRRLMPCLAP